MSVMVEGVVYNIVRDKYNKFNDYAIVLGAKDKNATSLTINNVVDGAKVTTIAHSAFANMSHLETVFTADMDCLEIASYAFANCPNLKVVHSSAAEVVICQNAFINCKNLVSFWCRGYVQLYTSDCFVNCPKLTDVGTLYVVTAGCLKKCPQIKSVSFCDKVAIRGNVFKDTNIEEVFCYGDVFLHDLASMNMFLNLQVRCKANSNVANLVYEGANINFW